MESNGSNNICLKLAAPMKQPSYIIKWTSKMKVNTLLWVPRQVGGTILVF